MLKKRLIFSLLVSNGNFQLSRNFNLQKVGNQKWLYENYNLDAITKSIDELIVLNVDRNPTVAIPSFLEVVSKLAKNCFIPISLGGGIRTLEDGYLYMESGADKLVLGQIAFENKALVTGLSSTFGAQSLTVALDYQVKDNQRKVMINNGQKDTGLLLEDALKYIRTLKVGELILTSIDKDGTGQGLDLEAYRIASNIVDIPIIASGGIGKFSHFTDGLKEPHISAASTANIFNFMMNGLIDAREFINKSGIDLANWKI